MAELERIEDAARRLLALARRRRASPPPLEAIECSGWPQEALFAAQIVWRRRVVNEALSVDVARRLRAATARLGGLGVEIESALARLEEDEAAHVTLAAAVLARIGDDSASPPATATLPEAPEEPAEIALTRLTLTGLAVCETVSAARFAVVREHTDLPPFRAAIDLFHRDELAHAEMGFALVPVVLARLRAILDPAPATALLRAELQGTFGYLDRVVGLDFERRGGPPPARAQPAENPGVVEPALDAIAFYDAVHREILPRLDALGLPAKEAWAARWEPGNPRKME